MSGGWGGANSMRGRERQASCVRHVKSFQRVDQAQDFDKVDAYDTRGYKTLLITDDAPAYKKFLKKVQVVAGTMQPCQGYLLLHQKD